MGKYNIHFARATELPHPPSSILAHHHFNIIIPSTSTPSIYPNRGKVCTIGINALIAAALGAAFALSLTL